MTGGSGMPGKWTLVTVLTVAALAAGLSPVAAQDDGRPMTIRLEPAVMDGVNPGEAVVVKGLAGPVPQRFLLDNISYMNPIGVAVRPVKAGNRIGLSITKYAWNQPLRQGNTDRDVLRYLFRTEGEFQISITAEQAGTPYRLLVWVGDETKPDFAPVVIKASEFEGGGDGFPWTWGLVGLLAGIVVVLAVALLRRKRT